MLTPQQMTLILDEKAMAPLERLLICRFALDAELLTASQSRIAIHLGVSEGHIARSMARLTSMKCFKRNLKTGHLVLNSFDEFRLMSRDIKI